MPSAAQIMDVFNRDRNYTVLRRSRSERYARLRKVFVEEVEVYQNVQIHDKEVSASELDAIKSRIRENIKKEQRQQLIFTGVFTIIIFTLVALGVYWYFNETNITNIF